MRPGNEGDKTQKLTHWAAERAVVFHGGARISESESSGLGLQADVEFAKNGEEVAVKVPRDLVLNNTRLQELAEEDETLKEWISYNSPTGSDLLHRGLLYLWLKKGDSPWREYLDCLPKDVGLPFSLSVKEMEALGSISIMHPALSRRLSVERAHGKFEKSKLGELSLEQWLLPHQWIASRGVAHPETGEICMVPIVDLANHSSTRANARYDVDVNGDFLLYKVPWHEDADHPTSGLEDLLLDYGDRSSGEFVYNYGFVPEDRTIEDFEEVFKAFDPSSETCRDILDPSRTLKDLSPEDKTDLAKAYDTLLDIFSEEYPQLLRLVRLPKSIEQDESQRYKFHNNFVMALASQDHLEVRNDDDGQKLYIEDIEVTPTTVFAVVMKLKDKQILHKARQLVSRLCRVFQKQLELVPQDAPVYKALADREGELYEHYATTMSDHESLPP